MKHMKIELAAGSIAGSPYAAGWGLPDEHRIRILRAADQMGVADAAERYRVSHTSIYKWRRDMGWRDPASVIRKKLTKKPPNAPLW